MENLKSARLSRSKQNFEEAIRFYEKYFESRKNASVSNNVYREYIDCLLGTKIPSNIANAKKILIDLVDKGDTLQQEDSGISIGTDWMEISIYLRL